MQPLNVDQRLLRIVDAAYPSPKISSTWLGAKYRDLVVTHGWKASNDRDFPQLHQKISDAIETTSFAQIAEPGTGLPTGITSEEIHTRLDAPIVLELVHLTEVGIRAQTLEGVRQEREHRLYLDRLGRISSSLAGKIQRELKWLRPELKPYPRKRLKLFLSDGTTELQAIEMERLYGFELGTTPMGIKVLLNHAEVIGGVAYLRNQNVTVIGGAVASLQKMHRLRLYWELDSRVDAENIDEAPFAKPITSAGQR